MSHYYDNDKFEEPLAKARGMGSAKSGSHHWWMMKISSVALIPLMLWFFVSIMHLITTGASFVNATAWIAKPHVAVTMIIFLAVMFHHAAMGTGEVIMDYVPNKKIKVPALIIVNFGCFAAAVAGIASVIFIAFGS